MNRDSDMMDIRGVAAFLGVHVETVRRLARRGEIPSFKVGKDWRFRREALDEWAAARGSHTEPGVVLIIDDEELVCRTLARIVKAEGHRPLQATEARTGLELVTREEPDLVLLDLAMPGMNGAQFLQALRPTHPHLPVVIVTAHPDGELMHEAANHAPVMLIAKPFSHEQIAATIRMVFADVRRAGRASREEK